MQQRTSESARDLFTTRIIVFTRDRPGVLVDVSTVVTDATDNIIDVLSKTHQVGGESAFQYKVQVRSLEMVQRLMAKLHEHEDVVCVLRGNMDDMLHDSPAAFWAHAQEPRGPEGQT